MLSPIPVLALIAVLGLSLSLMFGGFSPDTRGNEEAAQLRTAVSTFVQAAQSEAARSVLGAPLAPGSASLFIQSRPLTVLALDRRCEQLNAAGARAARPGAPACSAVRSVVPLASLGVCAHLRTEKDEPWSAVHLEFLDLELTRQSAGRTGANGQLFKLSRIKSTDSAALALPASSTGAQVLCADFGV